MRSNIGNSSSQFSNCAWGVDFPLTLCSRGICLILCTLQRTFEHFAQDEHFQQIKWISFCTGRGWNGCWDQYLLLFIGGRCFARSMEVLRRRRGWDSCGGPIRWKLGKQNKFGRHRDGWWGDGGVEVVSRSLQYGGMVQLNADEYKRTTFFYREKKHIRKIRCLWAFLGRGKENNLCDFVKWWPVSLYIKYISE